LLPLELKQLPIHKPTQVHQLLVLHLLLQLVEEAMVDVDLLDMFILAVADQEELLLEL
jgi:hypothetical protein